MTIFRQKVSRNSHNKLRDTLVYIKLDIMTYLHKFLFSLKNTQTPKGIDNA